MARRWICNSSLGIEGRLALQWQPLSQGAGTFAKGRQHRFEFLHTIDEASADLVDELNANANANANDTDNTNLHWIAGMLSVSDIGRFTKSIVWTMHDLWAFCGGEHYAPDDQAARFRRCYLPGSRPAGERGPDLNRQTWYAKRRAWERQHFTIVSPSRWVADCAWQRVLLAKAATHVIPYPMEMVHLWRPIPRDAARTALGLPTDKKLILMGADGGVADPRKGGDLLRDALALVVARQAADAELMIYGQAAPGTHEHWPCPVHWLGAVRDDRVLALAYSAVDVMVVPSRQDNLPNTALEAQACGTPVVAFDIGGLPDIVGHQMTGWLAPAFDTHGLAQGIDWVMADKLRARVLATQAREQAVMHFSPTKVAAEYLRVYQEKLQ